jgi:catechol 2,3-dioxygenase-like lactoylglutathione lyase family enzyme
MIDHTGVTVRNPETSREFYEKALASLGYALLKEIPKEFTDGLVVLGYGVPPMPDFWLAEGAPNDPRVPRGEPQASRRISCGRARRSYVARPVTT